MPTKAHIDSLCVPLHDNISVRAVKHFVLRHETTAVQASLCFRVVCCVTPLPWLPFGRLRCVGGCMFSVLVGGPAACPHVTHVLRRMRICSRCSTPTCCACQRTTAFATTSTISCRTHSYFGLLRTTTGKLWAMFWRRCEWRVC